MRWLAVVLLSVVPGAAIAQDWRPEAKAQLDRCLSGASDRDGEAACLYLVNDACLAATGDETTIGMAECLSEETAAWDERLNLLWPEVVESARALDAEDAGADGGHDAALKTAQRAWNAFRDAECAWSYQRWSGGTIRTLFGASCQLEMTANRVFDFRGWQRGGG